MLFRDISFDMILFILAEILQAHFHQIRILQFFRGASFLHISQLRVNVPELEISNSKPYRIFKYSLILLMIRNNGGNKLFLLSKFMSSKGSRVKHSQNQGT